MEDLRRRIDDYRRSVDHDGRRRMEKLRKRREERRRSNEKLRRRRRREEKRRREEENIRRMALERRRREEASRRTREILRGMEASRRRREERRRSNEELRRRRIMEESRRRTEESRRSRLEVGRSQEFRGSHGSIIRDSMESDSIFYSNGELSEGEDIRSHMKKIIVLADAQVCTVCFQDMNSGDGDDDAVGLKCSHIFHENCILKWAKQNPNCPVCRHDIRIDGQQNSNVRY
ncbi:hypothetical protein MKX03_009548 [Papaver bracteatum]|nr:hypothetical protein MKX03_009548 [Papaver bracteatum]